MGEFLDSINSSVVRTIIVMFNDKHYSVDYVKKFEMFLIKNNIEHQWNLRLLKILHRNDVKYSYVASRVLTGSFMLINDLIKTDNKKKEPLITSSKPKKSLWKPRYMINIGN